MEPINSFRGQYNFLSNFFTVPHGVYGYHTNENFFQAMKFPKGSVHREIIKALSPAKAKQYAKEHKKDMRTDWFDINLNVMFTGLQFKFNPDAGTGLLATQLIATGDAWLEEGNYWHDQFWGNCTCAQHADAQGDNNLGLMLMWIRAELINPHAHDKCSKCGGSGKWLFGGHFENGVWKGQVGECYNCKGTGTATVYDEIRSHHYYLHHYKVGE